MSLNKLFKQSNFQKSYWISERQTLERDQNTNPFSSSLEALLRNRETSNKLGDSDYGTPSIFISVVKRLINITSLEFY
jgi:hypothetical protein